MLYGGATSVFFLWKTFGDFFGPRLLGPFFFAIFPAHLHSDRKAGLPDCSSALECYGWPLGQSHLFMTLGKECKWLLGSFPPKYLKKNWHIHTRIVQLPYLVGPWGFGDFNALGLAWTLVFPLPVCGIVRDSVTLGELSWCSMFFSLWRLGGLCWLWLCASKSFQGKLNMINFATQTQKISSLQFGTLHRLSISLLLLGTFGLLDHRGIFPCFLPFTGSPTFEILTQNLRLFVLWQCDIYFPHPHLLGTMH